MRISYLVDFPAFVPELAAWHQAEWGEFEPEEDLVTRIRDLRGYGGAGAFPTALIAHEAGVLIGSALLLAYDLSVRPTLTPWLAGVYVRAERRGEGTASTLVGATIDEARRQQLTELWLYTPHNASLYARLGFEAREVIHHRGSEITLMSLVL